MARLSPEERQVALADLPGWSWDEARDAIARSFSFKDFS